MVPFLAWALAPHLLKVDNHFYTKGWRRMHHPIHTRMVNKEVPWNFSSSDKISPLSLTVTLGVNEYINPRFPSTPTVISIHLFRPFQKIPRALSFVDLDENIISSVSINGSKIKSSGGGLGISIIPCACIEVATKHQSLYFTGTSWWNNSRQQNYMVAGNGRRSREWKIIAMVRLTCNIDLNPMV